MLSKAGFLKFFSVIDYKKHFEYVTTWSCNGEILRYRILCNEYSLYIKVPSFHFKSHGNSGPKGVSPTVTSISKSDVLGDLIFGIR